VAEFDSQAFEWLMRAVASARDELEEVDEHHDYQSEESLVMVAKLLDEALEFGNNILKDMEYLH